MIIIGDAVIGTFSNWNLIGRIAFPIFAFQASQGYIHTSNLKKYMSRLLIFACISQLPFSLFLSTFTSPFILNIFFTLFLGIVAIYCYDKVDNKFLGFSIVLFIISLAELVRVDYGAYGVACVFLFYFFSKLINNENNKVKDEKNKNLKVKLLYKSLMCITFIFITILNYLQDFILYPYLFTTYLKIVLCTCIPLIPICLYNNKQGPKLKYLFYIFYPLHLLILYIVHILMQ